MPAVSESDWDVHYYWSKSSGLRLGVCDFMGTRVLHSASVPFVYVTYQGNLAGPFTDELQSTSADVEVREIMRGFDLAVTYDHYGPDYQYGHVWRFHDDGQFGSTIVIHGPGEEIDGRHSYHIPFRFDLDLSGKAGDSFQVRAAEGWTDVERESRHFPVAPPAWDWRVIDKETSKAALVRARRQDDADLWAIAYKPRESWGSWGGVLPGVPGTPESVPAVYEDGQSIQNTNVVLWYIAHLGSVDRVVACGPWFRLQGFPVTEPTEPEPHGGGHHDDHHDGVGPEG